MRTIVMIVIVLLVVGGMPLGPAWAQETPSPAETPPPPAPVTTGAPAPPTPAPAAAPAPTPAPATSPSPNKVETKVVAPTAPAATGTAKTRRVHGPGIPGPPGPPGPPPSAAQVQRVVEKVLASMDGAPVPAGYQPVLDLAVSQGYVAGFPDGSYRWQRRASRAEVTLIVMRVAKSLGGKIETLDTKLQGLETRVVGLEGSVQELQETDTRHDKQIGGIYRETGELRQADQGLRSLIDWRTAALVLLVLVVGVGAALTSRS